MKNGIEILQDELIDIKTLFSTYFDLMLIGDFNARTGVCNEYLDNETMNFIDNDFPYNSLQLERFSKDLM